MWVFYFERPIWLGGSALDATQHLSVQSAR